MKFFNNKEIAIKFSIRGAKYSVPPNGEFNLKDSIALVIKKKLISYGLSLEKVIKDSNESKLIDNEPKPEEFLEEPSPITQEEDAPKKRGRRRKD